MFCNIFHLIVAGVWGAIVCYLSVNAANGHNAPITHNPTPAIITILTMCQYNNVTDLAGLLRMLSHRLGRVVPRHDSWAGLGCMQTGAGDCHHEVTIGAVQSSHLLLQYVTITAQLTMPASNP